MHRLARAALLVLALAAPAGALTAPPAAAQSAAEAQVLVDKSALALQSLAAGPQGKGLRGLLNEARAILIVPNMVKAGFIVGGQVGDGVMLARGGTGWSNPAFYSFYAGSVGLQIGVESAEVAFLIMTDAAFQALLDSKVQLGATAGLSVGTVGGSIGAGSSVPSGLDIYVVSRSTGLFGGGALEGSYLQPLYDWNQAYYGAGTKPRDVILDRRMTNPGADGLIRTLAGL